MMFRRAPFFPRAVARWAPSYVAVTLDLAQTANIALSGSVTVSGDIQVGTSFDLAQTANIGLSASASVSGDIQSLSGALDLSQTAAIALSGTASVSGDIQIGTSFDLAQSGAVALSGSATVSGDIQIASGFDLAQTNVVALSGVASVSGDVQSSTAPVVDQPMGGGGWAWASPKKSRYSYLPRETREQMAERVRKQREALGILPKRVQKRVEIAATKEARRADPSLAPLAPVAVEIAQDTGISLQAVADAIQAVFESERGLVLARIQADAARGAELRRQEEEQQRVAAEVAQREWQKRLQALIAEDDNLLMQDESARKQAIETIRQTQKALLALLA